MKKLLKRESFLWQNASMVHLFSRLFYNRSKASSKANSPHSTISFKGEYPLLSLRSSSSYPLAIDHTNNGTRSCFILFGFMLIVVVIKFTAPTIQDTPAKCREKMARSTDAPACAAPLATGG